MSGRGKRPRPVAKLFGAMLMAAGGLVTLSGGSCTLWALGGLAALDGTLALVMVFGVPVLVSGFAALVGGYFLLRGLSLDRQTNPGVAKGLGEIIMATSGLVLFLSAPGAFSVYRALNSGNDYQELFGAIALILGVPILLAAGGAMAWGYRIVRRSTRD